MNRKIFAFIIMTISVLLLATLVNAQPETVVWTDKSEYGPGETGTLYIVFYNDEDSAVTIEKITIVFEEWRAYRNENWEGNQTLDINQAIISKGAYEKETTFTVPTNGRAKSTHVDITIKTTELGNIYEGLWVTVTETPKYMEQVVTLFTIQVVLLIVCTIIIAATIFLSARRPQVTWKPAEKAG